MAVHPEDWVKFSLWSRIQIRWVMRRRGGVVLNRHLPRGQLFFFDLNWEPPLPEMKWSWET
jgi:hypothetical protein